MKWSPDAGEAPGNLDLDGSGPLPGLPVVGAPPGWLHLEFCAEPGARTRLELSQGPFTEPQESVARGWWDRALSHLDRLFEGS
jgi:hypothetical protein